MFSQRGSVFARRLPKPEDGCGLTKVKNTRIVGGSEAPVGECDNRIFAQTHHELINILQF